MSPNPFPKNWILLRGLIRSKFHWKKFADEFKSSLQLDQVVQVELPGNGFLHEQSTPPSVEKAIQALENQLPKFTEPVGVLGISLGGMLGTAWAQRQPQKFSHLVLINSSSAESPFYHRLIPENYFNVLCSLLIKNPARTENFILGITSNEKSIWQKQLAANIDFLKEHPISTTNFLSQLKLASQVNFKNIPEVKKLVLTSKADRLVSYKCSEKIANLWSCPVRYHQTAGHDLPLDDAAWVIQSIKDEFLK